MADRFIRLKIALKRFEIYNNKKQTISRLFTYLPIRANLIICTYDPVLKYLHYTYYTVCPTVFVLVNNFFFYLIVLKSDYTE